METVIDIFAAIGATTVLFALLFGGLLWAINPPPPRGSRLSRKD